MSGPVVPQGHARMAEALGNSAASLLNALPHPVLAVLPDGSIAEANAAAEGFFEMSRPALRRQKLASLVAQGSPLLALVGQVQSEGAAINEYRVSLRLAKPDPAWYAAFDVKMARTGEHGLSLLSDLRRAIDENQFYLQYQPKISLGDRSCIAAEVLIRWQHPTRGFVPPDQFIPFAEQTGCIKSITRWVLARGLAQLAAWRASGLEMSLNINVSTRDLVQQDLPALVRSQLLAEGVAARHLCLEVTESAIMEDPTHALASLQALHDMGVQLSIDDFGTGYSSLAYLKKLPVQELKIDRSFVMNLDLDDNDLNIVRSTIGMAHHMGLKVVAEGVETESVAAQLKALGCDGAQGYLFSRPLNADELLKRCYGLNLQAVFCGHFHGFTERPFRNAIITTDKCCSRVRFNHDGTPEKGWFICQAINGEIKRRFVEFHPIA